MRPRRAVFIAGAAAFLATMAPAFAQGGPVAIQCAKEIQEYWIKMGHANRQTHSCLEAHRSKFSSKSLHALDITGGGRGRNRMC